MRKFLILASVAASFVVSNMVFMSLGQAKVMVRISHRSHHICHWQPTQVRVWSKAKHHWVRIWAERRVCL